MRRRVAGTRWSAPVGKRVSFDGVSCRDVATSSADEPTDDVTVDDVICLTGDVTATARPACWRTNKTTGWCAGHQGAGRWDDGLIEATIAPINNLSLL